jgi:hypothetical protein
MKTFPAHVSAITGAVRSREVVYVSMMDDELAEADKAHGVLLTWHKGTWFHHILPWTIQSLCVVRKPLDRALAIGGDGQCLLFGQGAEVEGIISPLPTTSGVPGPFRAVRAIDGEAYAVGMGGLVMHRSADGAWTALDQIYPRGRLPRSADLESIAGFGAEELYAVGWGG